MSLTWELFLWRPLNKWTTVPLWLHHSFPSDTFSFSSSKSLSIFCLLCQPSASHRLRTVHPAIPSIPHPLGRPFLEEEFIFSTTGLSWVFLFRTTRTIGRFHTCWLPYRFFQFTRWYVRALPFQVDGDSSNGRVFPLLASYDCNFDCLIILHLIT